MSESANVGPPMGGPPVQTGGRGPAPREQPAGAPGCGSAAIRAYSGRSSSRLSAVALAVRRGPDGIEWAKMLGQDGHGKGANRRLDGSHLWRPSLRYSRTSGEVEA